MTNATPHGGLPYLARRTTLSESFTDAQNLAVPLVTQVASLFYSMASSVFSLVSTIVGSGFMFIFILFVLPLLRLR